MAAGAREVTNRVTKLEVWEDVRPAGAREFTEIEARYWPPQLAMRISGTFD